jgi:TatD DNase family protein
MIDIGANLAHDSFERDRDAVLQRAWDAGLSAIVVTGSSRDSSLKARALAHAHPGKLYATAGLHPHHAADWNDELAATIRELAADPAVVSLGECGLDYFRNFAPHDAQRAAFVAQLELAVELGKPLFLHQRDAHTDFVAILREFRPRLGPVCVHCFTDTRAALEDYLALDCSIGITGWICDERRGRPLYELAPLIPAERLLVETDAPYLLPRTVPRSVVGGAERRNEPAFLPYVVQALAQARGASVDAVAAATVANARRFFDL